MSKRLVKPHPTRLTHPERDNCMERPSHAIVALGCLAGPGGGVCFGKIDNSAGVVSDSGGLRMGFR
jgi:hypothetical protein